MAKPSARWADPSSSNTLIGGQAFPSSSVQMTGFTLLATGLQTHDCRLMLMFRPCSPTQSHETFMVEIRSASALTRGAVLCRRASGRCGQRPSADQSPALATEHAPRPLQRHHQLQCRRVLPVWMMLGAPKTAETQGSYILFPRPKTRRIPEITVCRILMLF